MKGSSQEVHQYRGFLCDRRLRRVRETHVAKESFSGDVWRCDVFFFSIGGGGDANSSVELAAYGDGVENWMFIETSRLD